MARFRKKTELVEDLFPNPEPAPTPEAWQVPYILFRVNMVLAGLLTFLVLAAPIVPLPPFASNRVRTLAGLFAKDATIRQTALAGALGLCVTACVFFRARKPEAEPEPAATETSVDEAGESTQEAA